MVSRVGDLPEHIGEVADTQEMLVMDGTTFALTRVPAIRFRGSSIFTGTEAIPSNVWIGANGGAFREGDMFVQTNGADVSMWQWVVADGDWVQIADFNPPVYHTADSLDVQTYEIAIAPTMDTADADFSVGDFYRHTTLRRLYGPYDETTGFNFDPIGEGFVFERGPVQHINIDLDGRDVPEWHPSQIIDEVENAYYPLNGDTYFQALADVNHGGYIYTFNRDDFLAEVGDHEARLLAGWSPRVFARVPRVFNLATAPVDADHLTYITGDYIYDTVNRAMWGPYVGTADVTGTAIANRDAAWGTAPDQNRLSIMHVIDNDLVDYVPEQDNAVYAAGDTLLVRNIHAGKDLPIMYGPYTPDTPWPEIGVMRGPVRFNVAQAEGTVGVFGALPVYGTILDTIFTGQGLPAEGDTIRVAHTYPDGHATGVAGEPTGRYSIFDITEVNRATGAVTTALSAQVQTVRTHVNASSGVADNEDDIYRTGDILIDSLFAVYGPYVEGAVDGATAWPLSSSAPGASLLQITQDGSSLVHTLKVDENGNLYLEEV